MTIERQPDVYVSKEEGVATVLLHNPDRGNALTRDIYIALTNAWDELERDTEVRAVVFTASGERHFCTGGDVESLNSQGLRLTGERTGENWRLTWSMAHLSKPVIVSVNGTTAGGGLGFVTDGDIVFASRNAKFLDPHVNVGMICGYGSLRLASIVGPSEAKLLALAGGVLTAERALQLGLVNALFDTPAESLAAAQAAARKISQASPEAVRRTFELLRRLSTTAEESEVLGSADDMLEAHRDHPDAAEGTNAWLERRSPCWSN